MDGGIGEELRPDPARLAGKYFERCVAEGLQKIPTDRRGHSPIFLASTAGMRLVRSESPEAAEQILGNVSFVLERSGLLFSDSSVRIISGKEEAVAGWISANYLLRTIYPKPCSVVGMLDMGGASTQITFAKNYPNADKTSTSIYDTSLQLYGSRHDLYARSYMCFGQNQLQNRYKVLLLKDAVENASSRITITSPCHNIGYKETVQYKDIVNACTRTDYTPLLMNSTITFEGSSDPQECARNIRILLDPNHCANTFKVNECFSAPPPHSPDTKFVAVSGMYYTISGLKLDKGNPTLQDFLSAAMKRCQATWDELSQNDKDFNPKYAAPLCFNAQYLALLYTEGYGITKDSWKNIEFLKKVNGTSVGWTMGFTIRNSNAFPEEAALEIFSTTTYTVTMFVLALVIGVCITLLIIILVKSTFFRNDTNRVDPDDKCMVELTSN